MVQRSREVLGVAPACLDLRLPPSVLQQVLLLHLHLLLQAEQLVEQVANIREVLARPTVKVVFFGRTSAGKSTLVNALLGEEVLPMGHGHTTSCFIQIQVD